MLLGYFDVFNAFGVVLLSGKHLVGLREKLRKEGEARKKVKEGEGVVEGEAILIRRAYQIIVADAADAVSVKFSGQCKFLQI